MSDIETIKQYVPDLRQSGRTWKGTCPWCNDLMFSFDPSVRGGTWHCFGKCQLGGNVARLQSLMYPPSQFNVQSLVFGHYKLHGGTSWDDMDKEHAFCDERAAWFNDQCVVIVPGCQCAWCDGVRVVFRADFGVLLDENLLPKWGDASWAS